MGVLSTAAALRQVGWSLSPWAPAPRPSDPRDVDSAFLTSVLAADHPGARIESLQDVGGSEGTTDRRRVVLRWNAAGRDAALPSGLFLKGTSRTAKNRAMAGGLSMATNEVLFYERVSRDVADICPRSFAATSGHGARHLLVLEDLVAAGAKPYVLADECDVHHADGVVRALAQLHAAFEHSPRFATDLAFAKPMTQRAGAGLLRLTMRRVRSTFLKHSDRHPIGPHATAMLQLVQRHDRSLYARWERGAQTLLHGDSHLGNTFQRADGRAGLLHWQVVFRDQGIREVAYFLGAGVPVELRRTHERTLVQTYLDVVTAAGGTAMSFDDAWLAYRFYLFDAWDSASICVLWPGLQSPENVEASVVRVNAAVEDLEDDRAIAAMLER